MLEYVKSQLREQFPQQNAEEAVQEQLMDQAVLECAHLFQEFDELSMNGQITNGPRQFANVDIPLENDIDVTTVELNLLDGRVVDVPMDATVQESDYSQMKTIEDFFQEALEETRPLGRETRPVFEQRCYGIAERNYQEYMDYVIQEGLFGFGMISIDDARVPAQVHVNCGTRNGQPYALYIDVFFTVDKKHRITKKQLESIQRFQQISGTPSMGISLQNVVFNQYGGMCGCDSKDNIWEHAKPIKLHVPVEPANMFMVAIEIEFEDVDTNKMIYWQCPVKSGSGEHAVSGKDIEFKPLPESKARAMHTISKKEGKKLIAEAAAYKPRVLNRFVDDEAYFQEGIDFGDADAPPATDADKSGVTFGGGDDASAAAPDANAAAPAGTDTPPAEGAGDDTPKEVVASNDVSGQIAEKIADETQAENTEDEGLSVDGVDDADVSTDDTPSEADINAELGDSDENSVDEAGASSDVDVDNMTPEELKAAAADKIEKMTFQQIKDFLANGEGTSPDDEPPAEGAADGEVQEAFFLTRGNIGKELDIHLRKTLGILNDSEMELGVLCAKFRKQGKRLQRRVHKAANMRDVFNETERQQLLKLNSLLTDLMAMMRADLNSGAVPTVKRLVKAFVQQAMGVAKLVEQKEPGKPVQEAATSDDHETDLPFADLMKGEGYPIKEGSKVPIYFFGQKCMVELSSYDEETLKRQRKLIGEFMVKSKTLFDDSVRDQIRKNMEYWKSEMTDEELKSADWDHPEKHMKPKYLYVNDTHPHAPRTDGRYDWRIMVDCDWDFDEEHGLAVSFDENLKLKNVTQAGNLL